MAKKPYEKVLNGKTISSTTKKEFVINFLTAVFLNFSHLNRTDRILSYLNFFCENFEYDNESRDSYIKSKAKYTPETFRQNETALFNLLYLGKGVCMQFAQSLALLSAIDNEITHDMPQISYAAGLIKTATEPQLGHSLNLIFSDRNNPIVIDISSMIHAKSHEFSQDKMAFGMVYLNEYLKNLEKEKISFLPLENETSLQCYNQRKLSVSQLYDFLNKPIDKMGTEEKRKIFYFNLDKTKNKKS